MSVIDLKSLASTSSATPARSNRMASVIVLSEDSLTVAEIVAGAEALLKRPQRTVRKLPTITEARVLGFESVDGN